MMNLQQICWAVTSAFVLLQELTRRAEILMHLHLPSAFLAVRLCAYGVAVCEQMSLSPPLPKGRGRGIQIHAPIPVGQGSMPSSVRISSHVTKWTVLSSNPRSRVQFSVGVNTAASFVTPRTVPTTVPFCSA